VQQSNSGLGRLIVEVSRSHAVRQAHMVGLLWTSVAETATYTAYNIHKRQTPSVLSGIKTREPSNQNAENLRLKPHGHRHQLRQHARP